MDICTLQHHAQFHHISLLLEMEMYNAMVNWHDKVGIFPGTFRNQYPLEHAH